MRHSVRSVAALACAAAFTPSSMTMPDPKIWARIVELHGSDGMNRLERHEREAGPLRPPHTWTLATIGTHPRAQGRGLGSAVLSGGLAAIDARGDDCLLETSTAANVGFYRKFGFRTVSELPAIDGRPEVTIMWRVANQTGDDAAEMQTARP